MRSLSYPLGEMRGLFTRQAAEFAGRAAALSDLELLDPSRCRGWSRLDLIVHVRGGLDEMAAGAAAVTDASPDRDAASYWAAHPDDRDDDPVPHILWLRRTAAAYARPSGAVQHLRDAATRASAAVAGLTEHPVPFQGQVLGAGDFVATWVVELAIHQLDLGGDETPAGCVVARHTLEAIAEAELPAGLDDRSAVLAGLGRAPWPEGLRPVPGFPVSL